MGSMSSAIQVLIICIALSLTRVLGQDSLPVGKYGIQRNLKKSKKSKHRGGSKKAGRKNGDIESQFLVTLIGRVKDFSENDYGIFENRFADAYNYLTNTRNIIDVEINYKLDFNMTNAHGSSVKTYIYDVEADCHGQCFGATLTQTNKVHNSRSLQPKKGKKGDRQGGLPTEDELRREYQNEIRSLNLRSLLSSIDVAGVAELKDLPSPGISELRSTNITIDFTGDTSLLPSDLQDLEEIFLQSYDEVNALNSQTCDPFFRTVSVTTARPGPGTPTVDVQNYQIIFSVDFTCRGCSSSERLFDDTERRLQTTDVSLKGIRGLKKQASSIKDYSSMSENDYYKDGDDDYDDDDVDGVSNTCQECFCPINALYGRAPTTVEFLPVFDNYVRIKVQQGIITYINSVDGVTETSATTVVDEDDETFATKVAVATATTTSNTEIKTNDVIGSTHTPPRRSPREPPESSDRRQPPKSVGTSSPSPSITPSFRIDGLFEDDSSQAPSSPSRRGYRGSASDAPDSSNIDINRRRQRNHGPNP